MPMDLSEARLFFDCMNYTKAELEIIYGDAPKIKRMKTFDKLLDKCFEKYDDQELYFYLINKYDIETGELLEKATR